MEEIKTLFVQSERKLLIHDMGPAGTAHGKVSEKLMVLYTVKRGVHKSMRRGEATVIKRVDVAMVLW